MHFFFFFSFCFVFTHNFLLSSLCFWYIHYDISQLFLFSCCFQIIMCCCSIVLICKYFIWLWFHHCYVRISYCKAKNRNYFKENIAQTVLISRNLLHYQAICTSFVFLVDGDKKQKWTQQQYDKVNTIPLQIHDKNNILPFTCWTRFRQWLLLKKHPLACLPMPI
jgi:hypothetical protein